MREMRNLWNSFKKSEEGMSLVSVTIAAGIMGMIAMFVMKMQDNQLKTQNDIVMKSEANTFLQKLTFYLSKPGYCEKTFKDTPILPNGSLSLTEVISPAGQSIYKVGDVYGDRAFRLVEISQDKYVYDTEDENSGILTLKVGMERLKKSFGTKVLNKKIEIYLYTDENGVVSGCGNSPMDLSQPNGEVKNLTAEDVKNIMAEEASKEIDQQKVEDLQKVIDNNPQLKLMQESIKSVQEQNKKFEEQQEKVYDEDNPPPP